VLIDGQTLRELEVFSAAGGAPSLFDILNRTHTPGGREALLRRFRRPFPSATDITAVQDTLRFILDNRAAFDWLPSPDQILRTQTYLNANFTAARSSGQGLTIESYWIHLRYRDIYNEARAGVDSTFEFLQQHERFFEALQSLTLPPLLYDLLFEMRAFAAREELTPPRRRSALAPRVFRLDQRLRGPGKRFLQLLIEATFELEALVSMADVTAEKSFVFPEIDAATRSMQLDGVFHPFIDRPVSNDLHLTANQRAVFLTGPNMAGKTTYLKSCAIAVFLAQLGMGVPARRLRCAPFGCLFTGISTPDSLREGTSFFQAEARRVKQVAELLRQGVRAFVVFDEMLKGTNVKDALDASRAVIRGLVRADDSVFLISSHLLELVPDLEDADGVVFSCFDADVRERELRYDYRLKAGHSAQRLGMRVMEQEGVFESLAGIRSGKEARRALGRASEF
jgi:DNA mismatch repair protein MutS